MTAYNPTPPPDELRERLFYRDGNLWWNPDYKNHRVNHSKPVGFVHKNGHKQVRITVDKVARCYKIARLIWWIVTEEWPEEIDHIDRNPLNNNINNLRAVDRITNCYNRGKYNSNKNGYIGVYKSSKNLWGFQISVKQKRFNVSGYEHPETAALARDVMARLFYGDHCELNLLDKNINIH